MTLNNIKTLKNQKGFTIVELLIVIVVIAILAAIVIVAYNGVQNRARTASGQSLANTVVKKAEAYNSLTGVYPTHTQLTTNAAPSGYTGSLDEAKLDSPSSAISGTLDSSTALNGKAVRYAPCGTTGATITYFRYEGTPGTVAQNIGTGC